MSIRRRHTPAEQEDEGFFVSMTDMMVGMLFLFILMLMFFALKFNEASVQLTETTKDLTSAEDTRKAILETLQSSLKSQGIQVEIDTENGILRLPESILFPTNRADLTSLGIHSVGILARALGGVLPCYTHVSGRDRPAECPEPKHTVESVFVEGHTDNTGTNVLNWNLSSQRALNTYQTLISENPELERLLNTRSLAVFGISGYGQHRPVQANGTAAQKAQNRRIDLRFIMTTPKAPGVEKVEKQVEERAR